MPSRIVASSAQASVDAARRPIRPIAIQNVLRSRLFVMIQSPFPTLAVATPSSATLADAHMARFLGLISAMRILFRL